MDFIVNKLFQYALLAIFIVMCGCGGGDQKAAASSQQPAGKVYICMDRSEVSDPKECSDPEPVIVKQDCHTNGCVFGECRADGNCYIVSSSNDDLDQPDSGSMVDAGVPDVGTVDDGRSDPIPDAGQNDPVLDAGSGNAGEETPDAGSIEDDAGVPDAGVVVPDGQPSAIISLVSGGEYGLYADSTVIVDTKDVPVLSFKIAARNEPLRVRGLTLRAEGKIRSVSDFLNYRLYLNNESFPFVRFSQMSPEDGGMVFTVRAVDNLLPTTINPDAPLTVRIVADAGFPGVVYLGDEMRFSATVSFVSVDTATNFSGAEVVGGKLVMVPFKVAVTGDSPTANSSTRQDISPGDTVARFKIVNNGKAYVEVNHAKFFNAGVHSGFASYRMFYSDENDRYPSHSVASTSASLDFGTLQYFGINGGAYRYVSLAIAQLINVRSGDSWSIGVQHLGDLTYSVSEANLGYDCNVDGAYDSVCDNLPIEGTPQLGSLIMW